MVYEEKLITPFLSQEEGETPAEGGEQKEGEEKEGGEEEKKEGGEEEKTGE